MSLHVTADRRILKAFYTQYVAVLLIVLVFSVGVVARAPQLPDRQVGVNAGEHTGAVVGVMELADLFTERESAEIKDSKQLEAALELVKNHDIRATFTVYATSDQGKPESVYRAISQARSIYSRAQAAHIPRHAVRMRISPAGSAAPHTIVSFESMEVRDEIL